MKPRLVGTVFFSGLAAALAGAFGVVPSAAAATGLRVVPSPVITNSCLSGAALTWIIQGASRWSRAGPESIRAGQFDLTRLITYHEGDRTGKTSPLPPSGPEST